MLKKLLFLTVLTFTLLPGCRKTTPEPGEIPVLSTVSVSDNDASGITFTGEFSEDGIFPVTSYGFLWDNGNPEINRSDSVVLGHRYKKGMFKTRLDHSLAEGVDYNVRAYAIANGNPVYGNTIHFKSKGSVHGKWSLETDVCFDGISRAFGCSGPDAGFIAFAFSQFYTYNMVKKEVVKGNDIPIPSNAETRILPVYSGNTVYIFSENKNKLFKLENNYWTVKSQLPFRYYMYGGYYHAMAVKDTIFILSTYVSYKYDINADKWTELEALNAGSGDPLVMGGNCGNRAYLVTSQNKMWEYNTLSGSWSNVSTHPGSITNSAFVSFGWDNKIYFAQTGKNGFGDNIFTMWCYDTIGYTWQLCDKFPVFLEHDASDLFGFVLNNKFYIGIGAPYRYRIWTFDPAK